MRQRGRRSARLGAHAFQCTGFETAVKSGCASRAARAQPHQRCAASPRPAVGCPPSAAAPRPPPARGSKIRRGHDARGQFQGSFVDFPPHAFDGWFSGSNFLRLGVHLWYLEALFLCTIALLPLLYALIRPAGRRLVARLAGWSARTGMTFAWALPLALAIIALDPGDYRFGGGGSLRGLALYPLYVVYGFLIFSEHGLQAAIVRQRLVALAGSVVMAVGMLAFLVIVGTEFGVEGHLFAMSAYALYGWCAIVALLIGFYVIPLALPAVAKWLLIAPAALLVSAAVYEYAVRRSGLLRVAFGLKPAHPAAQAATASPRTITT